MRSRQGVQNFTDQEAEAVIGKDRESSQRDLYEAIEKGMYPRWTMFIQVMTEDEARAQQNNPFDITKMWPKDEFPLIEVGELELNRNPENYFAEVEQAAFTPANIVPGIGYSPDRMLQTRILTYADAHRYRLGVNHHQIPVNAPHGVAHPHSFHRDGQMRVDGNLGSELHYEPNSYGDWADRSAAAEPMQDGGDVGFYDYRHDDHDYFTQPGQLWRAMCPEQRLVLCENTARNMGDATLQIKYRHINNCYQADPDYGKGVAEALGIDIARVNLDDAPVDSYQAWRARNQAYADLDEPTTPADPASARSLPPEGRDTNVENPASLYDWKTDPYLL